MLQWPISKYGATAAAVTDASHVLDRRWAGVCCLCLRAVARQVLEQQNDAAIEDLEGKAALVTPQLPQPAPLFHLLLYGSDVFFGGARCLRVSIGAVLSILFPFLVRILSQTFESQTVFAYIVGVLDSHSLSGRGYAHLNAAMFQRNHILWGKISEP